MIEEKFWLYYNNMFSDGDVVVECYGVCDFWKRYRFNLIIIKRVIG